MNKRDIYKDGVRRGESVASWTDLPVIGASIPKQIDWVGEETVTRDNLLDVAIMFAGEAEANDRSFSPFEFTAKEINESHDPDGMWEEFDRGITVGIERTMRRRVKSINQ